MLDVKRISVFVLLFSEPVQKVFCELCRIQVTKHESDVSCQGNWHEKNLNKEQEKVLLDLIDELIAEVDLAITENNATTKKQTANQV